MEVLNDLLFLPAETTENIKSISLHAELVRDIESLKFPSDIEDIIKNYASRPMPFSFDKLCILINCIMKNIICTSVGKNITCAISGKNNKILNIDFVILEKVYRTYRPNFNKRGTFHFMEIYKLYINEICRDTDKPYTDTDNYTLVLINHIKIISYEIDPSLNFNSGGKIVQVKSIGALINCIKDEIKKYIFGIDEIPDLDTTCADIDGFDMFYEQQNNLGFYEPYNRKFDKIIDYYELCPNISLSIYYSSLWSDHPQIYYKCGIDGWEEIKNDIWDVAFHIFPRGTISYKEFFTS